MKNEGSVVVVCRYRVKAGQEAAMEKLLAAHWPTLHRAGLVTDEPAQVYRGLPSKKPGGDPRAQRTYVEVFAWKDERAPEVAHQTPAVMAVWEPMGAACEEMEFPHFEPLELAARA